VCYSNYVPKTRCFSGIRLKNAATFKSGSEVTQRHWRWLHLICHLLSLTSNDTFDFENTATLKSGSGVTQGHRNWYHSTNCLWLPISVLQKLCPWDTPFLRLSPSKIPWTWNRAYGSLKDIENDTIWYITYDFLLMFHSNYGSVVPFLRYSMLNNIATLKFRSSINQGNWKWYHSIDGIWFHVSVL